MTYLDVAKDFASLNKGDDDRFDQMAEAVFRFQTSANPVYARFANGAGWEGWRNAPMLPIEAFKLAPVAAHDIEKSERVFVSSGTGRGSRARHHVADLSIYEASVVRHFKAVFGDERRAILAHLPGYSDAGEASSLVYMARILIERFGNEGSGFTLDDEGLIESAIEDGRPVVLLGAAFGLVDLIEEKSYQLPGGSVVIETGGMKTYRKEITRPALHKRLADGFGLERSRVYSEYGMCELLSQLYTRGGESFIPPPWMRVRVVDPLDPSRPMADGMPGALAVVDLANVYSASFILTQDRAVVTDDGVSILGRLEGAELRGCNFLLET